MVFDGRFSGRRAVVTGGASGIGLAIATRLIAEGAAVALWDQDEPSLGKAAGEIGAQHVLTLDVAQWPAVEAAAHETAQALGGLDVLVTSAAITGPNATLADYPIEAWRRVIDINLNGVFYCNRAVIPFMQQAGYGRIVNIASIAGKEGNPNAGAYSSSKAGVIGLTKSLGKELAASDIRVNCVTPAAVRTPIFAQMTEEHIAYMLSRIPIGRLGEVAEVTALVTWLASEECSFSTGAVFDVSGGRATY